MFSGDSVPSDADPLAQAYAGHQFGHFTNLGDGRAVLLGEHIAPTGRRWDIQLKGSGRTPYSRGGDGRAVLAPMLREFIISEAMHALGVPTTRSLAVATTGEWVQREDMLPGAVLTRVAASHIRVGTFEYAAAIRDGKTLQALMEYTIRRHDPDVVEAENPALELFRAVLDRQAELIAQWMGLGFIHGVMNTDNMALSGETIDYGPCAFMDVYDPATVFSSIDRHGRYAYGNQPKIAHWNLARFGECLVPLFAKDQDAAVEAAEAVLALFPKKYQAHWLAIFRGKLGLGKQEADDEALINDLLMWMQKTGADFTNTFAALTGGKFTGDGEAMAWFSKWQARLRRESRTHEEAAKLMRSANPVIIPRNHRVEEALTAANSGDYSMVQQLLEALAMPFENNAKTTPYRSPPLPGAKPYHTFCGT